MAIPTVGVTRVACNTSTGNQAITVDVGGLTPKAALFIVTAAATTGTASDNAVFAIGAATSTSARWAVAGESEHNQATSDVASLNSTAHCVQITTGAGGAAIDAQADFVSFGADTVTINWTDAPASAWLMTVVAFAGADLSAFAGSAGMGNTTDNAVDVTGPSFEPDVVIAATSFGTTAGIDLSLGFAHNNRAGTVTQRSIYAGDIEVTTTAVHSRTEDRGILNDLTNGSALDFYVELSAFDSSGFTLTTRNGGANSQNMYYLALKLDAATSATVYTYSTPTGTGTASDNNAGFQPQAILYLTNLGEAAQTIYTDGRAGTTGVAVIGPSAQYCSTISMQDNLADSNTQSLSTAQAFDVPLDTGAAGVQGTFSSFGASGATYSYSTVTGTAKWWPALAFKTAAAAAAGPLVGGKLVNHSALLGRLVH